MTGFINVLLLTIWGENNRLTAVPPMFYPRTLRLWGVGLTFYPNCFLVFKRLFVLIRVVEALAVPGNSLCDIEGCVAIPFFLALPNVLLYILEINFVVDKYKSRRNE
jgi:hypothetical protein